MNVLEKILEEIEEHTIEFESFGMCDDYVSVGWVKEIIRSHIDEVDDSWISVKKRLPEGKEVIAQNKDGEMLIGYVYYSEEMEWYECESESMYLANVIAWQPLPKPMRKE
jgi:hypothetical protein